MYTKELRKSKITSTYIYGDIIGIIVPGVKFIWKMSFTLEEINEKNYQFHKYYLQNSKTNLTSSFQPASLIFKNCHLLPLTFDTWHCYFKEKEKQLPSRICVSYVQLSTDTNLVFVTLKLKQSLDTKIDFYINFYLSISPSG